MERPIKYFQNDPKWGGVSYSAPNESTTIGKAGCGPTCVAMAITHITGKAVTPVDTCKWSVEHGYKAKNQGTYYSYFVPQFKAYGIKCRQLNNRSLYHNSQAPEHDAIIRELHKGNLVIACMGKGLWTGSGHFILLYGATDKLLINDPASKAWERENGAPSVFFNEVKYYWIIEVPKEDEKMTKDEAKRIIKAKAGLSDATITYLDSYRWGDDLIIKLAKAMK